MTLSGLTNGTSYDVRVRACSSAGCGTWSFSESATPATNPGALPGIPTGLYTNGNIVSGEVSVLWKASAGATDYNLRYAVETCTDSVCSAGEWNEVNGIAAISKKLSAGSGSTSQLSPSTVYRLQVRGTNAYGQSNWSDIAFVYPTTSPLGGGTRVATAPFHGYRPKNAQGSHEFRYVICEDTITSTITTSSSDPALNRSNQSIINDIESAVDEWEDTVTWNKRGVNIVTTDAYTLPAGQSCARRTFGIPVRNQNQVVFVSDNEMRFAGCIGVPHGCWRTDRWLAISFGPIA